MPSPSESRFSRRHAPSPHSRTLPVLLVTAPRSVLRAIDGHLAIERHDQPTVTVSPARLRGVVVGSTIGASADVLALLADHACSFVQLDVGGSVRVTLVPPDADVGTLLLCQAALERDRRRHGGHAIQIAGELISLRIQAMDAILQQHERARSAADDPSCCVIGGARRELSAWLARIPGTPTMDRLRGIEGASSAAYWRCMSTMLTGELTTSRRTRRPPRDAVNAMLSFGYSLLCAEMTGAVTAHGLAPSLGLLHTPQESARPSLALDLVEPLRISIIDRMVLAMCNRGQMTLAHFEQPHGEPAVWMTPEGRKIFLTAYQSTMVSGVQLDDGSHCSVRCLIDRSVRWYIERMHQAVGGDEGAECPRAIAAEEQS